LGSPIKDTGSINKTTPNQKNIHSLSAPHSSRRYRELSVRTGVFVLGDSRSHTAGCFVQSPIWFKPGRQARRPGGWPALLRLRGTRKLSVPSRVHYLVSQIYGSIPAGIVQPLLAHGPGKTANSSYAPEPSVLCFSGRQRLPNHVWGFDQPQHWLAAASL